MSPKASLVTKRIFGRQKSLQTPKASWAHHESLQSPKESLVTERVFSHQNIMSLPKDSSVTKTVFSHWKSLWSPKASSVIKSIMSSPKEFSITKSIFGHQRECGTMLAQSGNKGLSSFSYVIMLIDIVKLPRELQALMPLARPKMAIRCLVVWNFIWSTKDPILNTPYT